MRSKRGNGDLGVFFSELRKYEYERIPKEKTKLMIIWWSKAGGNRQEQCLIMSQE